MSAWSATVLTLFPEMFPGPLGHSLAGKGLRDGLWSLEAVNIRGFADDRHQTVDAPPAGGGPGMVMLAEVLDRALESVADRPGPVVYLSPRGRRFDQALARELVAGPGVTLLCGRYEGIDQRVIDARGLREVSIGDFVLSGGEAAALTLLDACVRLAPGVTGDAASLESESFEAGLLEYPQYTRPADWRGRRVPEVLLSGHHEKIDAWRRRMAGQVTCERRPDLWAAHVARIAGAPRDERVGNQQEHVERERV